MKRPSPTGLMPALGHSFAALELLERALTHPSAASGPRPDNQRLEFLGDRVLGLVVAEALMEAFPDAADGDLAPRFNALVRRETLAAISEDVGLGPYLYLGRSENTSGGRRKTAILADAMEAVIAALYLDGGMDVARDFILTRWKTRITEVRATPTDAKTAAQEWAQGRGMTPPAYRLVHRSGPDHAPVFTVVAELETGQTGTGKAKSKKLAEQEAAADLMNKVAGDD